MARSLYNGYSSFEFMRTGSFKLSGVELVKSDLLNHIFTERGTRVMMPTFGTSIPSLIFEPLGDMLLDTLEEELNAVFAYDPRVEILTFSVTPNYDTGSVHVLAKLDFIELDTVDDFELNIEFEK
jgi:phage baseplate assembly protein W